MSNKKRFKSLVDGKPYVLITTANDQLLRTATDIVNEKFQQIKEHAPQTSREDVAVLLSLQVVAEQVLRENELEKIKQEVNQLQQALEEKQAELDHRNHPNHLPENSLNILKEQKASNARAKQQILSSKEEGK
ncbi:MULTISPECIES: cell division protein ZapA [unclassified Enterococcus]|uniref:cell division protein ZapA n=1 Tax=unclassified Enterococcus TaxID=2608891 RepID=UPI0015535548|nr:MULTISPECIES: cell division protein ZapA [unclassified Enterococcus]MBS7577645.1 cell division protein ZapA [Enterococcus sp. MMGLQ5-2]MBS7584161.1 cell division protein ZapA [Enterococcus sp. MMGLQ5-1]NPD12019.1 cell division protein ZapA [Enterococcus sp. MMGLQ5-1]NPD37478.1 cell division protein ZapA [Enterococcus sp. MMGLQ5-2]